MQSSNKNDKISKMHGKDSELYKYWRNDLSEHRYFEWSSIWFQAREAVCRPDVLSVLEFGRGRNLTKAVVEHFGIYHVSVDVGNKFFPDVVSSIEDFSTEERFDMVCAFEVLEHNPFEEFEKLLLKMKYFSKRYIYISLPFSGRWIAVQLNFNIPKLFFKKTFTLSMNRWKKKVQPVESYKKREDKYSPHWWEVGDKGVLKSKIIEIIENCNLRLIKSFHCTIFPYHLFLLMER